MQRNQELSFSQDDSEVDIKAINQQVNNPKDDNLLGFSNYENQFQSEIVQKYNPYTSVKVSGPKWSKEGGVGKYRLYKVETNLQKSSDAQIVYRRYKDFEWAHVMLQIKFPYCIIPPIPPKNALTNWLGDESETVQQRKVGFEIFLQKISNHRLMCDSNELKSFLTEPDHQFEEAKRNTQLIIAENSDQPQTYSAIAIGAVSNMFTKASTKLSSFVWAKPGGSSNGNRKYSFEKTHEGYEELERFSKQEDYLDTLKDSFEQLSNEIINLIDCTEETSKNYSSLSENFAAFGSMKGANIDQLQDVSKDISLTFQQCCIVKKQELEEQLKKLKEPIDDYKLMIQAAIDACNRRRQIVYKYHDLMADCKKQRDFLNSQGSDPALREKHSKLTKKCEDELEEVQKSAKELAAELKLFKQSKETELRKLIGEFITIQKKANEDMKTQWTQFIGGHNGIKESQAF